MSKYGVLGGCWVVPGITPPSTHPVPTTPGTPPCPHTAVHVHGRCRALTKHAVGLISVAQLTLGTSFSDIRLMTEVYNLVRIGDR